MTQEIYNQLLRDINDSSDDMKENVLCYFYYHSSNCEKCPKTEKCPFKLRALSLKSNL